MKQFNEQVWESNIYAKGYALNKYPYDNVVSFVFRNYPKSKKREDIKILEIGCGAGNNLWFAAREGFNVTGIDGSASAIDFAKKRFNADGLAGNFSVADFTNLPFKDEAFDIVIDRAAIVCVDKLCAVQAFNEVHRVLLTGGHLFSNLYSDRHSSCISGMPLSSGQTGYIKEGTLTNIGDLSFYSRNEIINILNSPKWEIQQLIHISAEDITKPQVSVHAAWEVFVTKK